jgi:hypothetical protein
MLRGGRDLDGFLEWVKLAGALLGIGTASFIVFDRLYRDRPIFALHVRGQMGLAAGLDNEVYLRIKNVTDEDIVIDEISINPAHLTLSIDNEIRSLVSAMVSGFNQIVVGPLGERLLILITTVTEGSSSEFEEVCIMATWRGTRRPWPWKRHVRIRTSVAAIRKLRTATAAG